MPYLPNIPIATQTLKSSQPQIQGNFQALNTVYGVDHYAYDEANPALVGRHKRLTIPVAAGVPSPGAGELAIYSKTASGGSQIFFKRDGSPTEYQLTNGSGLNLSGSPGFFPISAAFAGNFSCVLSTTTITTLYSSNVVSITPDPDPQNFHVVFTTPLSSANYYVMTTAGYASPGSTVQLGMLNVNRTNNGFYFRIQNTATGGPSTTYNIDVYFIVVGP